jgi:hypothetical protein
MPVTPLGIKPANCQFVVYCLNHYATARPNFFANASHILLSFTPLQSLATLFAFDTIIGIARV